MVLPDAPNAFLVQAPSLTGSYIVQPPPWAPTDTDNQLDSRLMSLSSFEVDLEMSRLRPLDEERTPLFMVMRNREDHAHPDADMHSEGCRPVGGVLATSSVFVLRLFSSTEMLAEAKNMDEDARLIDAIHTMADMFEYHEKACAECADFMRQSEALLSAEDADFTETHRSVRKKVGVACAFCSAVIWDGKKERPMPSPEVLEKIAQEHTKKCAAAGGRT